MRREKEKVYADCEACGEGFEQKRPTQKYCKPACRNRAWTKDHRPPLSTAASSEATRAEIEEAYQRGKADGIKFYWRERKKAQRERRKRSAAPAPVEANAAPAGHP